MNSKVSRLSPLTILFFIPLIPHLNVIDGFVHTDDLPILFFSFFALFSFKLFPKGISQIGNNKFIFLFIIYLFLQNQIINNGFIHSEILRYLFYSFLFIYVISIDLNSFDQNIPVYLFFFLSSFSILSYFLSLNLGTDLYQNWNIGLNLSDIDYIKGRVNGFQAGGPNSFADLITVTAVYSMFRLKDTYLPYVIIFSFLGCFFTYSRFSLIVLVLFTILKIFYVEKKRTNLGIFIAVFLVCINFGLIERFSSDDNSGIQDRVEMQTGTINYIFEDSIKNNLLGRGFDNYVVKGQVLYDADKFDEDNVSHGPHNSYLFIILNYGVVGLLLYALIFKDLIYKIFKHRFKKEYSPYFYVVLAYLVLSFSSDLLQNHSVSWFLYLSYFLFIKETIIKRSIEN